MISALRAADLDCSHWPWTCEDPSAVCWLSWDSHCSFSDVSSSAAAAVVAAAVASVDADADGDADDADVVVDDSAADDSSPPSDAPPADSRTGSWKPDAARSVCSASRAVPVPTHCSFLSPLSTRPCSAPRKLLSTMRSRRRTETRSASPSDWR